LRIAVRMDKHKSGLKEDWSVLAKPPHVMRQTARKSRGELLKQTVVSNEENWLALAHFASKEHQQNQRMLMHFFNTLLGLGYVRPWIVWSGAESQSRPRLVYSSGSLLSYLALQICLRAARVDAFVVCVHCQKEYLPVERAPKFGQRNFCPECRNLGISKKYALQDFRKRRRNSSIVVPQSPANADHKADPRARQEKD